MGALGDLGPPAGARQDLSMILGPFGVGPGCWPVQLSLAEPAIGRIIIIMIILITRIMLWQRDCSLSCPFVPPG